jgi:hypothetical protein
MGLPQTKDTTSQPALLSSPSVDQQPVTQPVDQRPVTQLVDPQPTAAVDVNALAAAQITHEPVQLSSLGTATISIGSVSAYNLTWWELLHDNGTANGTLIPSDLPTLQPAVNQPTSQMQDGGLSQEQIDDILIDYLESQTQGKDLSEDEANDLMNQLDEMQNKLDQQPAT